MAKRELKRYTVTARGFVPGDGKVGLDSYRRHVSAFSCIGAAYEAGARGHREGIHILGNTIGVAIKNEEAANMPLWTKF